MIRQPAVAGSFYPADPGELRALIVKQLASIGQVQLKNIRALVVPHAGIIYSGPVAAAGYRLLDKSTRKVWLLGPSHCAQFNGIAEAGAESWRTPLGNIKAGKIPAQLGAMSLPQAHEPEHCLEVQLPFLQAVLDNFEIYPLLLGDVSSEELAAALAPMLDNESLLIASSDLSHYFSYAEARRIDSAANSAIPSLDIARVKAVVEACGKIAILTLMQAAKIRGWKGHFIDYKTSGDTAGDKKFVVGYGCYAFTE